MSTPVLKDSKVTNRIDIAARKLRSDAVRTSVWGGVSVDTTKVFVSKASADRSVKSLRASLAKK